GTAAADAGWEVRIAERVEVAVGATGSLSLAIAVDRGLSVSKDAGVIVDLKTDLTLKKKRLARPDAVDPEADAPRFVVPIVTTNNSDLVGDHAVAVRVRFWLCAARTCKPIDVTKHAVVVVTPAP
ncbi:MAG: hypothetical protein NT062_30715, partial [Proteobacteria bacterium]|nr:hypothetical protein [Pseudomonadota bacterium]